MERFSVKLYNTLSVHKETVNGIAYPLYFSPLKKRG